MGFKKTGDWDRVERMVKAIQPEMVKAKNTALKRWGLKAEGTAKKHISAQDLNWKPLQPETLAEKLRKGYSENILVRTSTYFQSITSWVDEKTNTVYAGVKKEVTNKDGTIVYKIAEVHEFGSKSGLIPARPLWRPSFAETMAWHVVHNRPERLFAIAMKKY